MNISSIDKNEVEKFSNLASKWWDRNGELKMLHEINPLRLDYIEQKIIEHFFSLNLSQQKNLAIIDVGCGGGILTSALALNGYKNISGIDAAPENIEVAIGANTQHIINYFCSTPENLVSNNKQYDVVVCLEVVEHVANVTHFLESLAQLVKPGGMLIVSTINRNIKSYLQAIIAAEYILGWVPKNTHDHSKFLRPAELKQKMSPWIVLKELKGLSYSLTSGKWLLSDDISVNYFAYFVKI